MRPFIANALLLLLLTACAANAVRATPGEATNYYVAPDGDNSATGAQDDPWQTIQYALDQVSAGDTILVRAGIYPESVTVNVSGSAADGYITLQSYPGEKAILDGGSLEVPAADNALLLIDSQSYLIIAGLELRNYRTDRAGRTPIGIYLAGDAHHIQLLDNRIHRIENNGGPNGNAHGIAVYGTEAPAAIHDLLIAGNELYDLKLGNSESLVLNGNVHTFEVRDNIVHHNDNIGIDLIGFERTAPDPAYDQARDGIVSGNLVYQIDTSDNPAYGGDRSAAGIYVDGGTRIIVERNKVRDSNFGIEIASEHAGRSTNYITVRNNLLYHNHIAGLAMGGYNRQRGSTEHCQILNNTFFENDTLHDGSGELYIQFDTRDNVIKNNIFMSNDQSLLISNDYQENAGNILDYNLYFAPAGPNGSEWGWRDSYYTGFDTYRNATGNDPHSLFADPGFSNLNAPDLQLRAVSPARDAGENLPEAGAVDFAGGLRIQNGRIDLGAYEFSTVSLSAFSFLPLIVRR